VGFIPVELVVKKLEKKNMPYNLGLILLDFYEILYIGEITQILMHNRKICTPLI